MADTQTEQILSGIRITNYTCKVVEVKLNNSDVCLVSLYVPAASPSHRRDLPDVPGETKMIFYTPVRTEGAISVDADTWSDARWHAQKGWVLVLIGDGPLPRLGT